jgi:hypothetical protein
MARSGPLYSFSLLATSRPRQTNTEGLLPYIRHTVLSSAQLLQGTPLIATLHLTFLSWHTVQAIADRLRFVPDVSLILGYQDVDIATETERQVRGPRSEVVVVVGKNKREPRKEGTALRRQACQWEGTNLGTAILR